MAWHRLLSVVVPVVAAGARWDVHRDALAPPFPPSLGLDVALRQASLLARRLPVAGAR